MKPKRKVRVRLSRAETASRRKKNVFILILSFLVSTGVFVIYGSPIRTGITFVIVYIVLFFTVQFMGSMKKAARIKKIEDVFPDFLQLVASNLRAGMTVDRAMFLSSRPEFAPLDHEILQAGKDISTGKPVEVALKSMSKRINSEKVDKTLLIILSGIRAGGDLAVLLEETASSMRQRGFVEKKAASQVLMYVIFIFLAVAVFAPGLFSLSGVLVETMTNLMGGMSPDAMPQNLPVSFNTITISESFVFWFSLIFIVVMDIMAALVLGLVSRGNEKEGLRYLPVMLGLSLGIFFALGKILSGVMASIA